MLVTIGAFDGFHKGHSQLLKLCRETSANWGVITFEPSPKQIFRHIPPLFSLKERSVIARILNIPKTYFVEFSAKFRQLQPQEFWRLIRARFNVDGLVMGSDFRFGLNRQGNAEYLSQLAGNDGVKTIIVPLLDKARNSSTHVRELVSAGEVSAAREILGYPYFMMGQVIHGYGRGHAMHYPTANIDVCARKCVVAADGVYACCVGVDGSLHAGAVSIGRNPTFSEGKLRCEVHIPGFDGDIYGHELTVMFLSRLRPMRRFSCPEELSAQIAQDVEACRQIFDAQPKDTEQEIALHSSDKKTEVIRCI